ncbi:hypothetical protein [Winslowiella toletana]|uniref:hypothetical protein n=1 Tax=Winslowiella toletana TaxID=92490 RepID=UPI0028BEBC71|nr:hypothetical protein [Winslowiella toletana]WNN42845.1 hypothetical protein RIN69_14100 [Winslowiella toletana]
MSDKLVEWLKSGEYLPPEFRDFHNQKDLFKAMHNTIHNANDNGNPRDGHIYVVDTFLWYMARCGYTLQRSRKALPFRDMDDDINRYKSEMSQAFNSMLTK